jgi:hypothetical protein
VTFHKKIYDAIKQLQNDLDEVLLIFRTPLFFSLCCRSHSMGGSIPFF